ncbi:MAG: hypothetical protein NZ919_00780 [Candidatus Caldarchaeum sp.]|nr:hypothetical protein [Candidatus Caldarchaeum sp.]
MRFDYVYWIKVFVAAVYGYASAFATAVLESPLLTYSLLFLSALLYVVVAEALWRAGGSSVRRRQSYLNGVGGFAGVYLLTWLLFFNLLT